MKFEIVDFYPTVRNPKWKKAWGRRPIGTLHIYWVDQEIDIRGVHVYWIGSKNSFIFYSPYQTNFDIESQKMIRYPTFAFVNPDRFAEFKEFLKVEGSAFVEKYLQSHPEIDKRLKSKEVVNG